MILVLTDGFYEWSKIPVRKIPHRIVLQDGFPFAFAGIWSGSKDKNEQWINLFSIITTKANSLVVEIYDRMPVILQPQAETNWLTTLPEEAVNLLKPIRLTYYKHIRYSRGRIQLQMMILNSLNQPKKKAS